MLNQNLPGKKIACVFFLFIKAVRGHSKTLGDILKHQGWSARDNGIHIRKSDFKTKPSVKIKARRNFTRWKYFKTIWWYLSSLSYRNAYSYRNYNVPFLRNTLCSMSIVFYSLPSNYVQLISSFVALSARCGEGETQHHLLYFTSLLGDRFFSFLDTWFFL